MRKESKFISTHFLHTDCAQLEMNKNTGFVLKPFHLLPLFVTQSISFKKLNLYLNWEWCSKNVQNVNALFKILMFAHMQFNFKLPMFTIYDLLLFTPPSVCNVYPSKKRFLRKWPHIVVMISSLAPNTNAFDVFT